MTAPSTEGRTHCGSLQGGQTCQTPNTDSKQKCKKFWKRAGTREPGPESMGRRHSKDRARGNQTAQPSASMCAGRHRAVFQTVL